MQNTARQLKINARQKQNSVRQMVRIDAHHLPLVNE
jgi:hypothetical protein